MSSVLGEGGGSGVLLRFILTVGMARRVILHLGIPHRLLILKIRFIETSGLYSTRCMECGKAVYVRSGLAILLASSVCFN